MAKSIYKILVIEDDHNLRNNISELLAAEGYEVECAENGRIGLEKARKSYPHLILCDIMMPQLNGFEVLLELHKDPGTASIPLIFLTAKVEMENLRHGMKLGADDYLFKPFDINELLDAVKTRLKKSEINNQKIKDFQEQIAHKIPHELRTPLIPILGFSEMIEEEEDVNQIKEMVKLMGKSGKLLHGRIEKFIKYSELLMKDESSFITSSRTSIKEEIVSYFIKKIPGDLKPAERTKIKVEPSTLPVNETYLEIMIVELIENGLKFSDADKCVIFKSYKNNSDYKICIKDNGKGMTENEIRSITAFKKFGENQISEHGLGLGLALVQKITELHGGYLTIASEPHNYTTCEVTIPLH